MKILIPSLALVFAAGCSAPASTAYEADLSAPVSVTVDTFGPYLDPYGSWVSLPGYGRVWQPAPQYVGADFYPYGTGGRWVYTNAGWVFDSEYPFGWAVFHYGRWIRDQRYGWMWLPGTQWAPAWVSWRMGGPYVGWAPLGPRGALGFGYRDWCFVPNDRFTVRNVRAYASREYDFHRAVAVTQPAQRSGRYGPPPRVISQATGTRIEPRPVNQMRNSGRAVPPPRYRTQERYERPSPGSGQFEQGARTGVPQERYEEPQQPGFSPPARSRVPPQPGYSPPASPPPQERFEQPRYRSSPPSMSAPPAPQMRRNSPPSSAPPPPMQKRGPSNAPPPRR